MTKIIIITGPTASGKTNFAIKLAQYLKCEIINADSMQIYQENPILSAQPTLTEQHGIKHHLLGFLPGNIKYNIANWIDDVRQIIDQEPEDIIIVGGTGFYLKHLIYGLAEIAEITPEIKTQTKNLFDQLGTLAFYYELCRVDPLCFNLIDVNNPYKLLRSYEVFLQTGKSIKYWQNHHMKKFYPVENFEMIILNPIREKLYQNCNQRFVEMVNNGALNEAKYLCKQNYQTSINKTHGLPELIRYFNGELTLIEAITKAQQMVRNYAKRQVTWFKHQFNDPDLNKKIFTEF